MNLHRNAAVPASLHPPAWAAAVSLPFVAALFAVAAASVNAINGWWLDDLFSLWASDRTMAFGALFSERIITDSNPPLYYTALHFIRQVFSGDRAAVLVLNAGALLAATAAVFLASRRVGLSGLAVAGIAAFLLSGPVLYYTPEGRSYLIALAIVFSTSWYGALAITGFPEQLSLPRCIVLGAFAALTHVYAALFCGGLAAGLLTLAVFSGRRELLKPGLALGLSATAVFGLWLASAFQLLGRTDWIEFSVLYIKIAAVSTAALAAGSLYLAPFLFGVLALGLFFKATRPLFIAFFVAFFIFVFLPLAVSFAHPIILARYWQIGAAAFPVLLTFAARLWLLDAGDAPSRKSLAAGVAAAAVLVASSALGVSIARQYTSPKPFWIGAEIVRPLLAHCQGAAVHIHYGGSGRSAAWPNAAYSFGIVGGTVSVKFVDALAGATPLLAAGASPCPVLGWAEHTGDGEKSDGDLLALMKIEAAPGEAGVVRHKNGFVILKRPAAPEARAAAIPPFITEPSKSAD